MEKAEEVPLPPLRQVVRGLIPFFLVVIVVAAFFAWHFDFLWQSAAIAAVISAVTTFAGKLPDKYGKDVAVAFANWLTSKKVRNGLYLSFAALFAGTFFVSSVHLDSGSDGEVWVVQLDEPENGATTRVDSVRLDRVNNHDFLVVPVLGRRRISLLSNVHQRTEPLTMWPWSSPKIAYPERFQPVVSLAVLPVRRFLTLAGPTRPLRVLVTDEATGTVIADSTVTVAQRIPSFILSSFKPPHPDDSTAARWRRELQRVVGLKAGGAPTPEMAQAETFTDWSDDSRWLPVKTPLALRQRVRVTVFKASGDTVGSEIITLNKPFTDVVVLRRT